MFKQRFQPFSTLLLICLLMLSLALSGCSQSVSPPAPENPPVSEPEKAATRVIKDDMGRELTIPNDIQKVFSTSPIAAIMTYTLAPEKMAGWNYALNETESKYILPELRTLPNLGGWQSKSTGNIEEIIKAAPDVIISMGDNLSESDVSFADKLQQQVNIPVVIVKLPLKEMDKAYTFMGDLLGAKEKAAELSAYYKETLADIEAKAASIPQDKKVRVYYAEGADGLTTEPNGSAHIQTLSIVGGVNVAADVEQAGKAGQTQVSLEQVLAWDPDVIICWNKSSGGAYDLIMSDSRWGKLKAVQNKQVYEIPTGPYNWFDRPPSVNRIMGFKWAGNLLYPDVYDYDILQETKEFYQTFYHYDLQDQEAQELLANSLKK